MIDRRKETHPKRSIGPNKNNGPRQWVQTKNLVRTRVGESTKLGKHDAKSSPPSFPGGKVDGYENPGGFTSVASDGGLSVGRGLGRGGLVASDGEGLWPQRRGLWASEGGGLFLSIPGIEPGASSVTATPVAGEDQWYRYTTESLPVSGCW